MTHWCQTVSHLETVFPWNQLERHVLLNIHWRQRSIIILIVYLYMFNVYRNNRGWFENWVVIHPKLIISCPSSESHEKKLCLSKIGPYNISLGMKEDPQASHSLKDSPFISCWCTGLLIYNDIGRDTLSLLQYITSYTLNYYR